MPSVQVPYITSTLTITTGSSGGNNTVSFTNNTNQDILVYVESIAPNTLTRVNKNSSYSKTITTGVMIFIVPINGIMTSFHNYPSKTIKVPIVTYAF